MTLIGSEKDTELSREVRSHLCLRGGPMLYQLSHRLMMFAGFLGESLWHDLHGASYAWMEATTCVVAQHSAEDTE